MLRQTTQTGVAGALLCTHERQACRMADTPTHILETQDFLIIDLVTTSVKQS